MEQASKGTTRRAALLGALTAAPMLALPSAAAAFPAQGITPALAALLHHHQTVRREWDAHCHVEHGPMEEAWIAAKASVPHQETTATFTNVLGNQHTFTTEFSIGTARRAVADAAHVRDDYLAAAQEVIALAEARDAELARLKALHRVDEIEERHGELCTLDTEAIFAVAEFPARNRADLLAKLDFLEANEMLGSEDAMEAIFADVRNLVVEARS